MTTTVTRRSGGAELLTVRHLTKRFGGIEAVSDLDLDIPGNKIVGIVGPNGSGKTTLFNLITGFTNPTLGSIIFRGKPITGCRPHEIVRLGLARTFQQASTFPALSVERNVEVAVLCKGGQVVGQAVERTMALCGLTNMRSHQAKSLPYGLQKRLGIALAVATEPALLLLDEPGAGASDEEAAEMALVLRTLRDQGTSLAIIDHNMDFLFSLCDRVTVLDAGRCLFEGTPREVTENAEVVEAYLGQPERKGVE